MFHTGSKRISKRCFFQAALATAGALTLTRVSLFGQENANGSSSFKPFQFLHISDSHTALYKVLNGNFQACQFREIIRDAAQFPYEFVIDTGDLIQEYQKPSTASRVYKAFAGMCKGLPTYRTPGNHDLGDHFFVPAPERAIYHSPFEPEKMKGALAEYRKNMGSDYVSFTHNNCVFIGVNSVIFDSKLPEEEEQWTWFEKELQKAQLDKRTHIIVFTHYPIAILEGTWGRLDPKNAYYEIQEPSRTKFLDLLLKYKVRAVLSGHTHKFEVFEKDIGGGHNVQFISAPPVSFNRTVTGYLLLSVDEKGLTVDRKTLSGGFGRVAGPSLNQENWEKMKASWKLSYRDATPSETDLAAMSLKGPTAENFEPVKLPLLSANGGWEGANMRGDKDVVLYCPVNYQTAENMMMAVFLISNNALGLYLNGKKVFGLEEVDLKTEGKDHHMQNLMALDPSDFTEGLNHLIVHLRRPEKIQTMAFDFNIQSEKNVEPAPKPAKNLKVGNLEKSEGQSVA